MDDMVKAALAKWPNVPHCYGWLGLDSRGQWFMRDDQAQAAGPFSGVRDGVAASIASKGSLLRHDKLIDFIGRNYEADELGQWFFQNGPQRVYVELEFAPWIWRVNEGVNPREVQTHTGRTASLNAVWVDEQGHVLLQTDLGIGLVHTQDVWRVAERVEQGVWPSPQDITRAELPQRFGFVLSPVAHQAQT